MPQHLCQLGAKVILPLVSKAGGNTKMMAIHLREVHYRMAIMCNICRSFASMYAQSIHSDYKANCDKECMEHEGHEKVKCPQEEVQVLGIKVGILITQIRCHQGVIKSGMPLNTFHLVQLENISWFTS